MINQTSVCLTDSARHRADLRRHRVSVALVAVLALSTLGACGGMNRAVGVLPTTLDDLERETASGRDSRVDGAGPQR